MGIHMIGRAAATAGFVLAAMMIPSTASSQIIVRGVLYDDATGDPVRGTVMLVDPSKDTPVVYSPTDSFGQFSLQAANGVYQIAAIRPGYTSVLSVPVPFENGEQLTIRIPIAVTGDPQHRIGVVERLKAGQNTAKVTDLSRRASVDNGFDSRRRLGTGLQFDRARLEKANVMTLGEFLQGVPGLSVLDPNSTATMQMTRGGIGRHDDGRSGGDELPRGLVRGRSPDGHRRPLRPDDGWARQHADGDDRGGRGLPGRVGDAAGVCGAGSSLWRRRDLDASGIEPRRNVIPGVARDLQLVHCDPADDSLARDDFFGDGGGLSTRG